MNCFEDKTKDLKGIKFTLDCRQFMLLFLFSASQIADSDKCEFTDQDLNKACSLLEMVIKVMNELPDTSQRIVKRLEVKIAMVEKMQEAIKDKESIDKDVKKQDLSELLQEIFELLSK